MVVVNEINFFREIIWFSGWNGSFFVILRISCVKFYIFIGGGGFNFLKEFIFFKIFV